MKLQNVFLVLLVALFMSCGGKEKKAPSYSSGKTVTKAVEKTVEKAPEKKVEKPGIIDLKNKGIGPVKSLELATTIDKAMAEKGKSVFKNKCSSCHKASKKFIGPSPAGILERRSPEWVMNMILNPEEMLKKDPIAKELLVKFKGVPMANQHLTKEDARQVLEYFRTI
ncbi:c-type cytochrome [Tenacibaculum piscium]|uniref:c-type cytochrome n=1 Tax=Tenacibaculum piscium TaxID=1458515 RepID=UPI00187B2819|nr:cytochrome c [Tenacibaculum piscium]MBE7685693.1 c-type cytochrome [Tenacibaculum piscium]MCG8184033.1 c-type cytochrome [Tenacibaculum piscium]MCG8205426.1 c-type cytochrome [Tenacibaculum piscium]